MHQGSYWILLWYSCWAGVYYEKKVSELKWSGNGNCIIICAEWTKKEQLKALKVKRLDIKVQHGPHPCFFFTFSPLTFDKRLLVVEIYIHKPKLMTKWKGEKKLLENAILLPFTALANPRRAYQMSETRGTRGLNASLMLNVMLFSIRVLSH